MKNSLPSQHELIPNLEVLERLLLEKTPTEQEAAVQRGTEQLAYYLRGACDAIRQMECARLEAVKILDEPMYGPQAQAVLPSDKVDPISFALDIYLFCMRRTFDALIPYLCRCPENLSLPESFNDIVGGIKKDKYQPDSNLQTIIVNFWNDVGGKIKGYRDQTTHKAIIISNCIAFNSSEGPALKMLLPDNHEEKKPSELRYTLDVHVMKFACSSLEKTIRFVNALVEQMIDLMAPSDPTARSTGIVSLTIRGAPIIISTQISGERVPYQVDIAEVVSRALRQK